MRLRRLAARGDGVATRGAEGIEEPVAVRQRRTPRARMQPSRRGAAHARRVIRSTPPAPPVASPTPRARQALKSSSYGRNISTSVRDGENLPEMSVAVFPVDVLAAEATIDQHIVLAARAAPVREARGLDTPEDRVEVGVAHAKAQMVALELLAVGEVEGQRLVDVDRREFAPRLFPADTQEVGKELRRGDAMVRWHDDVVEMNGNDTKYDGVGTIGLL